MKSQAGRQLITIHIVSNISKKQRQSGDEIFLKSHAENETERIDPDSFCFLKKLYINKIKASGQHLSLNIF